MIDVAPPNFQRRPEHADEQSSIAANCGVSIAFFTAQPTDCGGVRVAIRHALRQRWRRRQRLVEQAASDSASDCCDADPETRRGGRCGRGCQAVASPTLCRPVGSPRLARRLRRLPRPSSGVLSFKSAHHISSGRRRDADRH